MPCGASDSLSVAQANENFSEPLKNTIEYILINQKVIKHICIFVYHLKVSKYL